MNIKSNLYFDITFIYYIFILAIKLFRLIYKVHFKLKIKIKIIEYNLWLYF